MKSRTFFLKNLLPYSCRQIYRLTFRRVANFVAASLRADDGANRDRVAAIIFRDGNIKTDDGATFVNIQNVFGKRKFSVSPARVDRAAYLYARRAQTHGCRNRILAVRTIRINVQISRNIQNNRTARRAAAFHRAEISAHRNGLGIRRNAGQNYKSQR